MGKLVLPAIVIVSLIAPHVALACLCGPRPSYCEQPPVVGDSANLAVFVGTVESVIRRDGEQHVRFHVEERFVGAGEASFEAFTRLSICDPVFEAGQRYLVEAGKSSDRWRSGACSMTTLAAQAAPEIEALRAWQQGREPVRAIQGVVLDATRRSSNQVGAAGIRIRLTGPRARLEARTDAEGKFQFNGLAKGTYSIAADEPGWIAEDSWRTATAQTIDLSKSSCGHVSLSMRQTWVSVRGHLAAPSGVSTAAVPIEVIPLTPIEGARHARNWMTAANGEFQLDDLETGDYLLALNVRRSPANPRSPVNSTALPSRFPPTYYPGTPNRAEAKVIHLERGKLTQLGALWIAPTPIAERRFEGRVFFDDGSPAAGATVLLGPPFTSAAPGTFQQRLAATDPDGSFVIWGLEGFSYRLTAIINSSRGFGYAWTQTSDPPVADTPMRVVLDHGDMGVPAPFPLGFTLRWQNRLER